MAELNLSHLSSTLLSDGAIQLRQAMAVLDEDQVSEVKIRAMSSPHLSASDRAMVLLLVDEEREIRKHEGVGRKAMRFWAKHGDSVTKAGLVGVGALFGVYVS